MKKFPMLGYWIALAVIVVLVNIPLLVTAYGAWLAQLHGCDYSHIFISICDVGNGESIGRDLHDMAGAGLYALITWPIGLVAFAVWFTILLLHRGRWKRASGVA